LARRSYLLPILALVGLALIIPAVAWAVGELTQKGGTAGCVSKDGTDHFGGTPGACQTGKGLSSDEGIVVSSDGKNVYVASTGGSVAIFDRNTTTGALTQKAGTAGCVSEDGSGGACQDGKGLDGAETLAVSADGKSVYVVSQGSNAVAVLDRNTTTGALTPKAGTAGCVSQDGKDHPGGTAGACQTGKALAGARGVVVSPNGTNVYVASTSSGAVAVFDRNTTTGELTQKAGTAGCVSETGSGGDCQTGKALASPQDIAISLDGKSVYVPSGGSDGAVAILGRNTTTGVLTQDAGTAGCVSETGTSGACQDGKALVGATAVAVSPNGRSVYVAAYDSGAVAIFDRDTATGALAQKAGTAGCISDTGTGGDCQDGKALSGPYNYGVAVSADGRSVYVGSYNLSAVAIFDRNTTTGALTQKAGTAGCVSEDGSGGACQDGKGLDSAIGVVVSPNGKNVYVAGDGSEAIAIFDRAIPPPPPPVISNASFASSSFKAKSGTKLRLTLSKPATVAVVVTQRLKGRKVAGKCKPKAKTGTRCKLTVQNAKLSFKGAKGKNAFRFRLPKLKPGSYSATIKARDAGGRVSKPLTLKFKVR